MCRLLIPDLFRLSQLMFELFGNINMWPWQCPNVSKLASLFLPLWVCMCVLSLQPTLQAPKCQVPHRQRSKYGVSLRFEQCIVNDVLYKVRCSYSYENTKWNVLWGFKADSPVWFIGPVEVMRLILRPFPAAMITSLNTCTHGAPSRASAHKMFWVFAPWKVCMLWREMQVWENSWAKHINFLEESSWAFRCNAKTQILFGVTGQLVCIIFGY